MAALTALSLSPEDEVVDEVVPASTWAKQGLTPSTPLAASSTGLIQYGPLTAHGNFLSGLDHRQSSWHPLPANEAAAEPPAEFIYNNGHPSAAPLASYDDYGTSGPAAMDHWPHPDTYDESPYHLFTHHPPIDSDDFHNVSPSRNFYDLSSSAPLPNFTPVPVDERQTLGPWEGIWAYNPNNVAENFVYPANGQVSHQTADSSASLPPSRPAQHSTLPPAASAYKGDLSPSHDTSMDARESTAAGEWVVVSRPSPSRSDPPRSAPISPASGPSPKSMDRPNSDVAAKPKSLKPEKTKRNRTVQVQLLAPRRQGPLSVEQRQKADDMRYYGACWRCRRYKKPCNGPGECDTCKTSGFRVWPSSIGCYRGNMEDFISGVMPGNAEVIMRDLQDYTKRPNWKSHFGYQPDMTPLPHLVGDEDRFTKLSVKLRATRMAGNGFVELLDILANFQRSRTKPDMCLEHVCEALSYICDVYHAFVVTDTDIRLTSKELLTALTKFRSHYSANWRHFLALCLSGRRGAWFPAFLCATINVPLLVVLKDGFVAIPEPMRSNLWPNISFLIEDLRNRLYPMGLDLLSALAKGIKPWKLRCWGMVPCKDAANGLPVPGRYERDPDGLRLLGGDIGAFDGFASVQAWLARHTQDMYHGVSFLTTPPFSERNARLQPVAALAWIFDVAPPGQKVVDGRLVDDVEEDDSQRGRRDQRT